VEIRNSAMQKGLLPLRAGDQVGWALLLESSSGHSTRVLIQRKRLQFVPTASTVGMSAPPQVVAAAKCWTSFTDPREQSETQV
jgi:hypothetical protein